MRAKDIMSTPVITIQSRASLKEAAALMLKHEIGSLPVTDVVGELVGILSEADIVPLETAPDPRSHIIPRRERPKPRSVRDAMTRDVVTVEQNTAVDAVARLMLEKRLRHIPVVEENRVVGMIARRDILRVLVRSDAEIQAEIDELLDDELLTLGRFRSEVRDGRVTVGGSRDRTSRHLAELLVRSVPGVIDVEFEGPR